MPKLTQFVPRLIALPLAATWALSIPSCAGKPEPVDYARRYPSTPLQSGSVDIQVFLLTHSIELTNTTATPYPPSTLWLNARFSRPIAALGIGESMSLPLRTFRDEFQDKFQGGGFFALEKPERLVLAQLEVPREGGTVEMVGLIVVRTEDE